MRNFGDDNNVVVVNTCLFDVVNGLTSCRGGRYVFDGGGDNITDRRCKQRVVEEALVTIPFTVEAFLMMTRYVFTASSRRGFGADIVRDMYGIWNT